MKKIVAILVMFIFLWIFLVGSTNATTYYVRADGNLTYAERANATSPDNINTSMNGSTFDDGAYTPGDRIKFSDQGGDYATNPTNTLTSGNSTHYVYYEAVTGETPTWVTGGYPSFPIQDESYIIFDRLTIAFNDSSSSTSAFRFQGTSNDNIIIRNSVINMSGAGTSTRGIWCNTNVAVTNTLLQNNTIVGTRLYDISFLYSGTDNITISGNTIYPGDGGRMYIEDTSNLTIIDHTVIGVGNTVDSVYLDNISGILIMDNLFFNNTKRFDIDNSDLDPGSYINNSRFNNVSSSGIILSNSSGIIIDNLTSTYTGTSVYFDECQDMIMKNSNISNGGISIYVNTNSTNITITRNEVSNGSSKCLALYGGSHDNIVSYNYFHDNGEEGVQNGGIVNHHDGYNNTIRNNIFTYNFGYGIGMHENTTGYIYNNVFYKNGFLEGPSGHSALDCDNDAVNDFTGDSWNARNNIFYKNGNLESDIRLSSAAESLIDYDYNLFSSNNQSQVATLDGGGTYVNWSTYSLREINSIYGSPQFVNSSGTMNLTSDFQLEWNSDGIDAGIDLNFSTDYLGNPIYGAPDIGAFEYQPPYNISQDMINLSISDKVRIYADGKYRYINSSTSSGIVNLSLSPSTNFNSTNYSQWMDLNITAWNSSLMNWTEYSGISNSTNVTHNVCNLTEGNQYNTYYTKDSTRTLISRYTVDSNGCIGFNYTHGYSTVIFEMQVYTESTTEEQSSSSSGSGGGLPIYYPTKSNLKEGYSKVLGKNWKLEFNFENENHKLKVNDIQDNSATITISSNPITFSLSINETKEIDLDNNGIYDIYVLLKNITVNSYIKVAEIFIKSIEEKAPDTQKDKEDNTTKEDVSKKDSIDQSSDSVEIKDTIDTIPEYTEDNKFNYIIIGLIGIIVIAFVVIILFFRPKPKKKRKKSK